MKIKETKILQSKRLEEICLESKVDFNSLKVLLNSVKTKKLLSKRNYHQQTISEIITKAIK